ncbi:MAG TPA: ATP-binding protein, partial [Pedobacter sp.]|nr:ATP-binding protein [Pedobacter sp.]
WYITVRLEYISLFLGIGLFGLYTRYLYPEDVSKKAVVFVSVLCISFAACSLLLSPLVFTKLINPFLLIMLFCIIYTPYVYFRAYRKRRPGAIYALASSAALMSVFTISLLHYWAITPQLQLLSFTGYIGFFFLQSMVLSHRVSFQLRRAKAQAEEGLKVKSDFLSTMSHEIRTPLNSVIGMSHMLLGNSPREDQAKQLDVMLFSANHLLAIVNDILDYNKIEAGKVGFEHIEMNIASIASNVITGLKGDAEKKGVALELHIDEALQGHVFGDPTRTFQVLNNLVHNAIKFTPVGYVGISIKVKQETEHHITLKFQVKDTGIGISADHQKMIFDRFTQADSSTSRGFGGTGLGLAICKRLLELQGASLKLESQEGKGSVFYFTQIFEKSKNTITEKRPDLPVPLQEDKPLLGISILLVEDNPMNVMVAQNFLKSWGADVDVAVNGLEALSLLDASRHSLVLMDLHMPIMDGYESAGKMRSLGVTLPIIALTANLPSEIEADVKLAGINDIVVKPFLPADLYRKIAQYLY